MREQITNLPISGTSASQANFIFAVSLIPLYCYLLALIPKITLYSLNLLFARICLNCPKTVSVCSANECQKSDEISFFIGPGPVKFPVLRLIRSSDAKLNMHFASVNKFMQFCLIFLNKFFAVKQIAAHKS